MKTLYQMLFPERGRVQAENQTEMQWEVSVTFLGYIVVYGNGFKLSLGAKIEEVLAIQPGKFENFNNGSVVRSDGEDLPDNILRFVSHGFYFHIDRDKLAVYASR